MQDAPERVIAIGRVHVVTFAEAASFAACVIGVTTLIVLRNPLTPVAVRQLALAAAAAIAAGLVPPLVRWRTGRVVVTTRRLTARAGLLAASRLDVPLADVGGIEVEQGRWGRLLGYGALHIDHPDGRFVLTRVGDPTRLRDAVLRQTARRRRP